MTRERTLRERIDDLEDEVDEIVALLNEKKAEAEDDARVVPAGGGR